MTSGWQGTPYIRRSGREFILKPAIFVKEMLGGGTVEQLELKCKNKQDKGKNPPVADINLAQGQLR